MSDPRPAHCPHCGAALPPDRADRFCYACLMSGAIPADGDAPAPPDPGALPRVFGGYRLVGLLGSGGMGTVYEAEMLATGRRVALKVLDRQLESEEVRQRFLREGRLAASIGHPNSLYLFGAEEIEGVPAITMEIAPGGTLQDRLARRGPLPVAEAVDAILDVLAGLEAARAAGVLHRDVKPSNCFVAPDGTVKIGDFGLSVSTLARDDPALTARGAILGTPAFAAPEQLRGDEIDGRADLYATGATLFALLTGRAPFEGENVVQVVANAIDRPAPRVRDLRPDVPPDLARVVARCLAKEPDARFPDYRALRDALLPFGSREPAPASMRARMPAAWIDFLIAFLPAYLVLMAVVGAGELIVRPLVERTAASARYHGLLLACGLAYFAVAEGWFRGGVGKRWAGLRVVRAGGGRPGLARGLVRVVVPLACFEAVAVPCALALDPGPSWSATETVLFVLVLVVAASVPAGLAWRARAARGFATPWDRASGTRVVRRPRGAVRPAIVPAPVAAPGDDARAMGPFETTGALVPGAWLVAVDPVLERTVWLLRRAAAGPSAARRDLARPGRLRWLQAVEADDGTWDAYEAPRGVPFSARAGGGRCVPWRDLRHWLHDLATELWAGGRDGTLPPELGLDHVWIDAHGRALLLDRPWPAAGGAAETVPVGDAAGRQRFLDAVASRVEAGGLPLHARRVLRNLAHGRFENLAHVAGSLRGMLERPAEVGRAARAGSVFLLPGYVWIAFLVGRYHDKPWDDPAGIVLATALGVLGAFALLHLLALPLRATAGQWIFRLAVVDRRGEPADRRRLLARWAAAWLPLLAVLPFAFAEGARPLGLALLAAWLAAAAGSLVDPHRGLHDRLAGTRVVRR